MRTLPEFPHQCPDYTFQPMTDIERVRLFLRQVRRRALLVFGLRAAGFTAAAMLTAVLLLGLTATWIGPATSWRTVTILILLTLLLVGLAMLWGLPARRLRSMRALAAFAGERHPPLASDLLSAVELDVGDDHELPNAGSLAMTRAFFATVADAAAPIDVTRLLPLRDEVWAGLAAALAALVLVLAVALSPGTIGRGLCLLAHRPSRFEAASPSRDPLVADLRITYQYPAYTALAPRVVEGSTGDIVALRGTHVLLEMRPLRSTRQALLLPRVAVPARAERRCARSEGPSPGAAIDSDRRLPLARFRAPRLCERQRNQRGSTVALRPIARALPSCRDFPPPLRPVVVDVSIRRMRKVPAPPRR